MFPIVESLNAVKAAMELVRKAADQYEQSKVKEALRSLNDEYIKLQTTCVALLESNNKLLAAKTIAETDARELKEEIRKIKDAKEDIRENFEPWTTGSGAFVYRAKVPQPGTDLRAILCANCAEDGKKTYLLPERILDFSIVRCPNGHGHVRI
jgi:hypothetical protein